MYNKMIANFKCPNCKTHYKNLNKFKTKYKNKLIVNGLLVSCIKCSTPLNIVKDPDNVWRLDN